MEKLSLVGIIPAALKDDANLLSQILQFGPNSYSVGLSPAGEEPFTHFGFHATSGQTTYDMLSGVTPLPLVPWEKYGLSEARVIEVRDALTVSVKPMSEWGAPHFDAVAASLGLVRA